MTVDTNEPLPSHLGPRYSIAAARFYAALTAAFPELKFVPDCEHGLTPVFASRGLSAGAYRSIWVGPNPNYPGMSVHVMRSGRYLDWNKPTARWQDLPANNPAAEWHDVVQSPLPGHNYGFAASIGITESRTACHHFEKGWPVDKYTRGYVLGQVAILVAAAPNL